MSQILELAGEYLDCGIKKIGWNVYGLDFADGSYSSLRIFTATDTAYHYTEQRFYSVESFAKYICRISGDELDELIPQIKQNELLNLLTNSSDNNTGLSLQDVVAPIGYNDYLKDKRMLTKETCEYFDIEVNPDGDIHIPLHDVQKFQRVGSLVRSAHTNTKWGRYHTLMVGSHSKPHCWPSWNLQKIDSDTIFVIMEGVFSLMRLQQVCLQKVTNVIPLATLTNHFDEDLFDLIHEFPIICLFDPDDGGQVATDKARKFIDKGGNIEFYKTVDETGLPLYLDEASDEQLRGLMNSIAQTTNFNFKRRR